MISSKYLYGADKPLTKEDFFMSEQTKKIVRAVSTGVTICGVVGLFISGATEVDVSNAVKVGTMIAAIVGSLVTTLLPRK
jgi:hypothetical protein